MVQCVKKNLPASSRNIGSIPAPGSGQIPHAHIPQLLSPHSRARELQQEKVLGCWDEKPTHSN